MGCLQALAPLTLSATFHDPPPASATLLERAQLAARRLHGAPTALVALAAANLDPPAEPAAIDGLLGSLERARFSAERLGLQTLSELAWALRKLGRGQTRRPEAGHVRDTPGTRPVRVAV